MDECFHDFYRSRMHIEPSAEPDIALLIERHKQERIFQSIPERVAKRTIDCMELGQNKIAHSEYLTLLAAKRAQYFAYTSSLEIGKINNLPIGEAVRAVISEGRKSLDALNTHQDRFQDSIFTELMEDIENNMENNEGDEEEGKENEEINQESTIEDLEESRQRLGCGIVVSPNLYCHESAACVSMEHFSYDFS
jgi:hypothetical protein